MHPVHFAIIGVVSLAFGLITPPYGLCLLIDCHIAGICRQPKEVQDRIRTAYERLIQAYAGPDGVKVPLAFKIGSGRRPFV